MVEAVRGDWKTLPLPSGRRSLELQGIFSDLEAEQIREGLIPETMEDKWFIFAEDGWVYFHRSWTGACIYWIKLDGSPTGARITESWVNTDPSQYQGIDPEFDKKLVRFLIDAFLLKRPAEFPRPAAVPESSPGLVQHSFIGRAYPEQIHPKSEPNTGILFKIRNAILRTLGLTNERP